MNFERAESFPTSPFRHFLIFPLHTPFASALFRRCSTFSRKFGGSTSARGAYPYPILCLATIQTSYYLRMGHCPSRYEVQYILYMCIRTYVGHGRSPASETQEGGTTYVQRDKSTDRRCDAYAQEGCRAKVPCTIFDWAKREYIANRSRYSSQYERECTMDRDFPGYPFHNPLHMD